MAEGQGHTCIEIGAISYFGWNHNGFNKIMKSNQLHVRNYWYFMYEIHGISCMKFVVFHVWNSWYLMYEIHGIEIDIISWKSIDFHRQDQSCLIWILVARSLLAMWTMTFTRLVPLARHPCSLLAWCSLSQRGLLDRSLDRSLARSSIRPSARSLDRSRDRLLLSPVGTGD